MGTKLLLVGILILCMVTAAQGYVVGAVNGAAYFIGGPPATNSNHASFGSPQAGGTCTSMPRLLPRGASASSARRQERWVAKYRAVPFRLRASSPAWVKRPSKSAVPAVSWERSLAEWAWVKRHTRAPCRE